MRFCPVEEWNPKAEGKTVCGHPQYTNASNLCEKHYGHDYPDSYERIKAEIECPECKGEPTKTTCPICFDRGWVNPNK